MLYKITFIVKTIHKRRSIVKDFSNIGEAREYVQRWYYIEKLISVRRVTNSLTLAFGEQL